MIEVMQLIDNRNTKQISHRSIFRVHQYLNARIRDIDSMTNPNDFLERDSTELVDKIYAWGVNGLRFWPEINKLTLERKKQILEIGLYLKGEFCSQDQIANVREILLSCKSEIENRLLRNHR